MIEDQLLPMGGIHRFMQFLPMIMIMITSHLVSCFLVAVHYLQRPFSDRNTLISNSKSEVYFNMIEMLLSLEFIPLVGKSPLENGL